MPDRYAFVDVYSLEEDYIRDVAGRAVAVILLFPDTEEVVAMRASETCITAEKCGEVVWIPQTEAGKSVRIPTLGGYSHNHRRSLTHQSVIAVGHSPSCML